MAFVKFRLAILLGFLGIVTTAFTLAHVVVGRIQSRQALSEIERQLKVTEAVFQDTLQHRLSQMTMAVRLLGADFAFKKTMSTRHPATIASNAESLRTRIGADILWVTDEKGHVYTGTTRRIRPGGSLGSLGIVHAALNQKPQASIQLLDGLLYQMVAVPIESPALVGALVAGFALNDKTAAELRQVTGADVSFESDGRIVASTLPEEDRKALEQRRMPLEGDRLNEVDVQRRRFLVLARQLPGMGTVYLQKSLDDVIESTQRLRHLLVVVGLASLALIALAGFLVTEFVTSAIQRLVEKTNLLNEELAQINRFQSQFFSVVVHDVGNPLTSSLGYAQLLRQCLADPKQQAFADNVIRNLHALSFLISDLVDFAAIESGKLHIELKPMDLMPVLKEIQGRMEIVAKTKTVQFKVSFPDSLPIMQGDANRLGQLLQNLCSNAVNYSSKGGEVLLKAEISEKGVEISVHDNGIGISPADLPKIFQRFFQAENARKHRGGGLGLGLKIAREIIESHGGALSVTSQLGKGSVFVFTLPAALGAGFAGRTSDT